MADSFQCMTKPTTIKKKIRKVLKKIEEGINTMCFDKPSAKFNKPVHFANFQESHTLFPIFRASIKLPFLLPPIFGTFLVSVQVPGDWKFEHQLYHKCDTY